MQATCHRLAAPVSVERRRDRAGKHPVSRDAARPPGYRVPMAAPGTPTIGIVIADDHPVVRRGLRLLLDEEPDFTVLAEAGDVEEARRYVLGHHPRVLVLDLNMPGQSSREAIPELRVDFPETYIVVLTMQQDPAYARDALAAGATGYVLKQAADGELVEAVRHAAAGERYLNPRLGASIAAESPRGHPGNLSDREIDVLRLIALGHTTAEIATQLFISGRTVESHRASIHQKLMVTSRADLVRYALDHHLVDR
jgi:two-component system, NarL family, response regulator NreC